jgi:2-polyprenyl-3-methyl-5-hydroxy-6-metoxy-1,4-benzoquinol methylase
MTGHDAADQIAAGERFAFGQNWQRFLATVDEESISQAENALRGMLGTDDLSGRTFLDIGCGSGLHSLAARRLGATAVSFDFDTMSVAATRRLKASQRRDDPDWTITAGDILDDGFLATLGQFDIVYSWGVLHHTGDLWKAVGNAAGLVAPGGVLWIALYNDQGAASRVWTAVKSRYNRSGPLGRRLLEVGVWLRFETQSAAVAAARRVVKWEPRSIPGTRERGMADWVDVVDWVGGWPFEVSKPEEVFDFLTTRGFVLRRLFTCGPGHGCNEYVFGAGTGP